MILKDELRELAERVEAATGPDDVLDWAIAAAVGCAPGLPYSASLDAAMQLVPEGSIWEVGHKVNYPAAAGEPSRAYYAFVNVGVPGTVKSFGGKSLETPALALTAAALRARASIKGSSDGEG